MSQVNRFYRLPIETQHEVEERLVRNGFSDYRAIADQLRLRGHRISKSALARHGQELKKRYLDKRAERLVSVGARRHPRRTA
jgi:hypothetical protein